MAKGWLLGQARFWKVQEAVLTEAERRLDEILAAAPLDDPPPTVPSRSGWAPVGVLQDDGQDARCRQVMGRTLLVWGVNARQVPADAIRHEVDRRARARREAGNPLTRAERARMKDEVLLDLLPRAFIRRHCTRVVMDRPSGWIAVGHCGTAAEDAIAALRHGLGSLEARPLASPRAIETMTTWAREGCPVEGVVLGDACRLTHPDTAAVVTCRGVIVESPDVRRHLEDGYQVTRLALAWNDRVSFILDQDLALRALKPLEGLDRAADADPASALDADLLLWAQTMQATWSALLPALEG